MNEVVEQGEPTLVFNEEETYRVRGGLPAIQGSHNRSPCHHADR